MGIELRGLPTQQVLVYDVKIRKLNGKWQIRYRYDGEMGTVSMSSLKKARQWCEDRQLPYELEGVK